MKQIGNLIISICVIIIFTSLIMIVKNFNTIEESCTQKGGLMVKGSNGWICAKVEKL